MAYHQYTQCVSDADHRGQLAYLGVGGLLGVAIVVGLLLVGGALLPGAGVAALLLIIAYCKWWLYDRLICLGGERCAFGMVLTVEPPENKSGLDAFDTDYSINLVLSPHVVGDDQAKVESDGIQGELIKNQLPLGNRPLHADLSREGFTGEKTRQYGNDPYTAVLHCEFEGGGVKTLYDAAQAALAFAAAATVVCSIPIFGWVACAILGGIAAVITIAGIIAALNDRGNPSDVNPDLGTELHVNDATRRGADLLVVKGEWVYDSAHEGWNELHPIRRCQRIGQWNGFWSWDTKLARDSWCAALDDADKDSTHDNQANPENQWTVHPVIDGCQPRGREDGHPNDPPPLH
jgi:hypothetical protein